ncbi:MAG: hypothetical protein LBE84_08865 [Planctomycetota bacterium]|jgi:hypothetical protein|nr:hypothetical protein [Planctomycetota bacterium]
MGKPESLHENTAENLKLREWRRKAKAEGMPFTRWMPKPRRDLEEGKQ